MGTNSLHLRNTGLAASAFSIPASVLNGDWTLGLAVRTEEYDVASRPFIALQDSVGRTRLLIGQNSSPWYKFEAGTGAATTLSNNIYKGAPPKQVFDDLIITYTAPTESVPGEFRVYLNGVLAKNGSNLDFIQSVPAGSNGWTGTDCRIVIGSASLAQDFHAAEVRFWTSTLSAAQVAAISNHCLADLDAATGVKASLYWYGKFGTAGASTVNQDDGTSALGVLNLTGDVSLSSFVPSTGWTYPVPDDLTAPTGGSVSATATSDTAIAVDITASSGVTKRRLYVSRGRYDYKYTAAYSAWVAGTGDVSGHAVGSLTAGTKYWVTVEEYDGVENMGLLQSSITTTGTDPDDRTFTPKALRFTTGDALSANYVNLPANMDCTVKLHIKRLATDGGGRRYIWRQNANSGGYSFLQLYSSSAYPVLQLNHGDANVEIQSTAVMTADAWETWFLQLKRPTTAAAGYLRIYKMVGTALTQVANTTLAQVTSRDTDWNWRKHPFQIRLGGAWPGVDTTDYLIQDAAWWTEALSSADMTFLADKAVYALDAAGRRADSLYYYIAPEEASGYLYATLGNHRGAVSLTGALSAGTAWSSDVAPLTGGSEPDPIVADRLTIASQPAGAVEGSVFTTQPVVRATNANGDIQTNYSGTCSVGITSGSGTLSGTTTVAFVNGVATFTDLEIDTAGEFTLTFTSGALAAATANLTVAAIPPAAFRVLPLLTECSIQFRTDEFGDGSEPDSTVLEWRKTGDLAWKQTQSFQRVVSDWAKYVQPADPRMASHIWGLEPETDYEFRVTFTGASYPAEPVTGTFRTLTTTPPAETGAVLHLYPSDDYYSLMNAFLSLTPADNAGKTVVFHAATPGGRTVVRKHICSFYDGNQIAFRWSGTAASWLTLKAAVGDTVIFDGSNVIYDTTDPGGSLWEAVEDAVAGITLADAVYRTKMAITRPVTVFYETDPDGDAWRLLDVTAGQQWKLNDNGDDTAKETSLGISELHARAALNEGAFAWNDADGKLYVRLHDGRDPRAVSMKIPVVKSCLDFNTVQYVRTEGLRIQYFGGNGGATYMDNFGGIKIVGSSDLVLDGLTLKGLCHYVGMATSFASEKSRILITDCTINERGMAPEWNEALQSYTGGALWRHLKFSKQEDVGIDFRGRQCVIHNCVVRGPFNGWSALGVQDLTLSPAQMAYPEAWEISGNQWLDIADDAIEPEQWGVGISMTRNLFLRCYKGISAAPMIGGPIYLLRNTFIGRGEYEAAGDKQAFLKLGNSDPGDTAYKLVAHNTVVNVNRNVAGTPLTGLCNTGTCYNLHFYNNYVCCDTTPVDFAYGGMGFPQIFDGNVYVCTRISDTIYSLLPTGFFGVNQIAIYQGEDSTGSINRIFTTFANWQTGFNQNASSNGHLPGYDGNVPQVPRTAMTVDYPAGQFTDTYGEPQLVTWLHDPNGAYDDGSHELVDPYNGNYVPAAGALPIGHGVPLAGITYDVGPGLAAFEEAGSPTAGAFLTSGAPPVNHPPAASLTGPSTAETGALVSGTYATFDEDRDELTVSVSLEGPAGSATVLTVGGGAWSFTPDIAGTYTVMVEAYDGVNPLVSETLAVVVTDPIAPPTNAAPVLSTPAVTAAPLGQRTEISCTASDEDGDELTVTVALSSPETSLLNDSNLDVLFNPATGAILVGLQPDVPGDYAVVVTAEDAEDSATANSGTISIAAPTTVTPPAPSGSLAVSFHLARGSVSGVDMVYPSQRLTWHRGSTAPTLAFGFVDLTGAPVDITGSSVSCRWESAFSDDTETDLRVVTAAPLNGGSSIAVLDQLPDAEPGIYLLRPSVLFDDGETEIALEALRVTVK